MTSDAGRRAVLGGGSGFLGQRLKAGLEEDGYELPATRRIALRTESELILKSRWVLPGVLTAAGYEFTHPELEPALRDLWRRQCSRSEA